MIYSIAKGILIAFLYIYHRVRVQGLENLPPTGPVIVVGNHVSYLDSFYIGALLPRRIHFMTRHESFLNPITSCFLHLVGAFPVNREKPEVQTMRTALQYLKQGEVVGIFPEGGIRGDGSFQELKQGAAYLAIKSGCPVFPVYIEGTSEAMPIGSWWIRPVRIRLKAGNVIDPPQTGSMKERQIWLSQQVQERLIQLKWSNQSAKINSSS